MQALNYRPTTFDSLDARIVQYKYAITKLELLVRAVDALLVDVTTTSPTPLVSVQYLVHLLASMFAIHDGAFTPRLTQLEMFKPVKPTAFSTITISQVVTHVAYDMKDVRVVPLSKLPLPAVSISCLRAFRAACVTCLEGYRRRYANALREVNCPEYMADLDVLFPVYFGNGNVDLTLQSAVKPSFQIQVGAVGSAEGDLAEAALIDMDLLALFSLCTQLKPMLARMTPLIVKYREIKHKHASMQVAALSALPYYEYLLHRMLFWALRLNDLYLAVRRLVRHVVLGNGEHLHDADFLAHIPQSGTFRTALADVEDCLTSAKKNGVLVATITRYLRMQGAELRSVMDYVGFVHQSVVYLEALNKKIYDFGVMWLGGELAFRQYHGLPTERLHSLEEVVRAQYQPHHITKPRASSVAKSTTKSASKNVKSKIESDKDTDKSDTESIRSDISKLSVGSGGDSRNGTSSSARTKSNIGVSSPADSIANGSVTIGSITSSKTDSVTEKSTPLTEAITTIPGEGNIASTEDSSGASNGIAAHLAVRTNTTSADTNAESIGATTASTESISLGTNAASTETILASGNTASTGASTMSTGTGTASTKTSSIATTPTKTSSSPLPRAGPNTTGSASPASARPTLVCSTTPSGASPKVSSPIRTLSRTPSFASTTSTPSPRPRRSSSILYYQVNTSATSLQTEKKEPPVTRRRSNSQPLSMGATPLSPIRNSSLKVVTEAPAPTPQLTAAQKFHQHVRDAARTGALVATERETLTNVVFDPNNPLALRLKRYSAKKKETDVSDQVDNNESRKNLVSVNAVVNNMLNGLPTTLKNGAGNAPGSASGNVLGVTRTVRRPSDPLAQVTRRNTQRNSICVDIFEESIQETSTDTRRVRFTGVPEYTPAEDAPSSNASRILKNFAFRPLKRGTSHAAFRKKETLLKKEESLQFRHQLHPDAAAAARIS